MRSRVLLAALALSAALPAAPAPAAAPLAVVEFQGSVTLGCLNCSGPAGIDASAIVVFSDGRVVASRFTATLDEDTTPDPCPVALQAFGEFEVAGITGEISWLRSLNAIVLSPSGGVGAAAVVADPVHLAFAACGFENETYPVAGTMVLS